MKEGIALRDIDAQIGKVCMELDIQYHTLAFSDDRALLFEGELGRHTSTLMMNNEFEEPLQGEECQNEISSVLGLPHPEALGDVDEEEGGSASDVSEDSVVGDD